jgi:uncharacterized protein
VHVRRHNIDNLEILTRQFAETFRGDRRFKLDFQHLRDMGGEGGKTVINGVSLSELSSIEGRLRVIYSEHLAMLLGTRINGDQQQQPVIPESIKKSDSAGESAGSRRTGDSIVGEPYICYAGKANSILIRANGRIGKCTVAFDDDRNDIGHIGDNGSLIINNAKLQPWIRGLGSLNSKVTGCPIKDMSNMPQPSLSSSFETSKRVVPILQVT